MHVQIEAFPSATKTLLDLLAQLLTSEGVVSAAIHGFHEDGTRVIRTLANNVSGARRGDASQIADLITLHKKRWIDHAIGARDLLIHPHAGSSQLMFLLELSAGPHRLRCDRIIPPTIYSTQVDTYAHDVVTQAEEFVREYLALLRVRSEPTA